MKHLTTLICLLTLSGCGTTVPMDELKAQALRSGDWTAVEKRERSIAKRESRLGSDCPSGSTTVCESRIGSVKCQCVDRNSMGRMLSGMW